MGNTKNEKVKPYTLERISSKMKKEFGSIPKGDEQSRVLELMVMEKVLLNAYLNNPEVNSRRAKEAISICLLKANGYINSVTYDFQGVVHKDAASIAEILSKTFIPYENEELFVALKDTYDFESSDELKKYFKAPIQCLIRIYESVEFWEKNSGVYGYFEFIKTQLLSQIDEKS